MPETKPWYLSKTLWFNIITILAAILAVPEITSIIPPEFLKYIVALNGIGNIILRVISATQLTAGK